MIGTAQVTILVLGTLALLGGLVGFFKGKSKASLSAGVICFVLSAVSYVVSLTNVKIGLILADCVALALFIIGLMRFAKTRKFMPAGLMMLMSIVALAIITLALVKG
ncbi:MAG: TMEM14 family protein [Candidatus Melainabacteria bacterium]|nr:TMEM14 family protein [Candidatus Melainabacteria bacterium]